VRPERDNIAAPVLPPRLRWLNAERAPVLAELTAAGPVLVHFFDFAQLNSVRALPYVIAWDRRYRDTGLTTLGVHSPRYPFTAERDALGPALRRLGVEHPVVDDSSYAVWHDYGCRGWPSLFLWGQGGALRWFHFGEGEYEATERAIGAELAAVDSPFAPPAPLEPLRPTDATGALVAPPSDEVFPGGSASQAWRGGSGSIELEYAAGGAHAAVSGSGRMSLAVDGVAPREIEVAEPGLYELVEHPRHSSHRLALDPGAGVDVYSVGFSPGLP